MKIANIKAREPEREEIRSFFGLNRQSSPGVGESRDEENVSSDLYPFLSPKRETVRLTDDFGTCRALIMKDQMAWVTDVEGGEFCRLFYAGADTGLVMSAGDKQLVSMGTKIIVFPDKVYYDTADASYGSLDASFTSVEDIAVRFTLSRLDGGEYEYDSSPTAPENPSDGALWCDTSSSPAVLMKYSETSAMWVAVDSTYVKISTPGIGADFSAGDGVTLSSSVVASLNGDAVIDGCGDDFIIVAGIITAPAVQYTPITVERTAPAVDFAVEYSNRIWACRSGLNNRGELVNEIYASKLGDPFNWNAFSGLVSDSYAAGVGSDGPFTGAAVFLGYVMFFKERCVHKVFGNRPSNFQIITSNIRGVAEGASRSLAVMDDVLFFSGVDGIMAYDGTSPAPISEPLGEISPAGAICVPNGKYLYVSALFGERRELYVLDTKLSLWHRYAPMNVDHMTPTRHGVIASADGSLWVIDSRDLGIGASNLTGYHTRCALSESWYFETGELTAERDDMYVRRVELTAAVPAGGEMRVELISDEDERRPVVTVRPTVRRTFTVPIVTGPHRRYRLRVGGTGKTVLYSIAKFVEKV